MLHTKRLSAPSRRRHLRVLARILTRGNANAVRYFRSLLKAFAAQRIGSEAVRTSLVTYFKKDVYTRAYALAMRVEEAYLMRERKFADKSSPVCHACMSYRAQVTCPCCQNVCFCIGCADYGACLKCCPSD